LVFAQLNPWFEFPGAETKKPKTKDQRPKAKSENPELSESMMDKITIYEKPT